VFGGKDLARDGGYDCSGFVVQAFRTIGIELGDPDYTSAQRIYDECLDTGDDVRPGDLIFFTQTYAPADVVTHLGIIRETQPGALMWDAHDNRGVGITNYGVDDWQQHYYGHRRVPGLSVASGASGEAWEPERIAQVTGAPVDAVRANWPGIRDALIAVGQGSRESQAAVLGTVAIETASQFRPVVEAYWLSEAARWRWYADTSQHAPYSGGPQFFGRGYIQLTHDYNYRAAGIALGVDLESNPDLALEPDVAARILAWYWQTHDIQRMADRLDWRAVRKAVLGGDAGLDRLIAIATALLA
jgi:hypothetical protein